MKIVPYLAMTAAEFEKCASFPEKIAWMACHYSPYGTGLGNLPEHLPPGSLLISNDRTPICAHDPKQVAQQLDDCVQALSCAGILLDFQRTGSQEIVKAVAALPCPVAVTPSYAEAAPCAVFLPPPAPNVSLERHLTPWRGREIWLEIATEQMWIRVTADGSAPVAPNAIACPHTDTRLHCRYGMQTARNCIDFRLQRDIEQLDALMREAAAHDISVFVGLYQQFASFSSQADAHNTARFQS